MPPDATPQKQEKDAPTPIRTPSHLPDFVWRSDLAEEPRYTPDWETDSEGNEDMESSSTSGEFVWQVFALHLFFEICTRDYDRSVTS